MSSEPAAPSSRLDIASESAERAVALLEEKGMEESVARELAAAFSYERIVDVVATMEWRKARGKCDNPGGFIREALVKQWQTPKAVIDARARAETRARAEEAERQAKANAHREQAQLNQEDSQIQRLIDSLDDDELAVLAQSVLEKYQGNVGVIRVLTGKPPRQCRLMKWEIAAMMTPAAR